MQARMFGRYGSPDTVAPPQHRAPSETLAAPTAPRASGHRKSPSLPHTPNTKGPAAKLGSIASQAAAPDEEPFGGLRKLEEYDDIKTTIFTRLVDISDLTQLSKLDMESACDELRDIVSDIVSFGNVFMSIAEQEQLLEDICNDVLGYGPLEPLLARDEVAKIMVNGADATYVEVDGKVQKTSVRFRDDLQLMSICQRIVSQIGLRVNEANPICNARLPNGNCVNIVAPPLAIDGPVLTIRKFKKDMPTLRQLIECGAINESGAKLLGIIGKVRCNVIISGGTGAGKTTLLNCLTGFVEPDERVATCEDFAELQLHQPHVVRLKTRSPNPGEDGEITMRDLVKNCLRLCPDRIIVGDVRGPEALDLLQAMKCGHDGSMGALYANSPAEAMSRLEEMITSGGCALPRKTIREMIVSSVDVVIQVARLRDGSRRITHVSEMVGLQDDVITLQDIFVYHIQGEDEFARPVGCHRSTGIKKPLLWERARYYKEEGNLSAALNATELLDLDALGLRV